MSSVWRCNSHSRSTGAKRPATYQSVRGLADAGHSPAARVALLMAGRGPILYGQAFESSVPQRQRWAALQLPPRGTDGLVVEERLASR